MVLEKIKYWWSEDGKWFCILVCDGTREATISLTPAEATDLARGKVIDASKAFRVVHEEHETIEIPEGFYRIIRQREYDEEQIRYVAD